MNTCSRTMQGWGPCVMVAHAIASHVRVHSVARSKVCVFRCQRNTMFLPAHSRTHRVDLHVQPRGICFCLNVSAGQCLLLLFYNPQKLFSNGPAHPVCGEKRLQASLFHPFSSESCQLNNIHMPEAEFFLQSSLWLSLQRYAAKYRSQKSKNAGFAFWKHARY